MLEPSIKGSAFRAGEIVYLRCRILGYDNLAQPFEAGQHAILEQVNIKGKAEPHGARIYVRPDTIIHKDVAVKEVKGT